MGNVPAPDGGLNGNSNYTLYSACNPVMDLSVTMEITRNIVAAHGLSFQLNANSPLGANCGWQQYTISFDTTSSPTPKLSGSINNWPAKGFEGLTGDLINHSVPLLTLPGSSPTLPAGYQLTISLSNDANGIITGVTFTVVDNQGNVTTSSLIQLTSLQADTHPPQPVTSAMLAPIYSFVLVLVGKTNGETTYLTTGAGTIIYSATSPLSALSQPPSCSQNASTEEQANSVYGELPANPSTQVVQSFSTKVPPTYTPGGCFAVSRQFGIDQTNLYAVSRTGQLDVFSVHGEGRWRHKSRLGTPGLLRPNAAVAASQHLGVNNQTDVFVIGQDGDGTNKKLYMFSVDGAGQWSEAQEISTGPYRPKGHLAASRQFGLDQTDVFLVDKNGQVNVFWVRGAGTWSPNPHLISAKNFAPEGAPLAASERFGVPDQTDLFVVDNDGQLQVFSVVSTGNWSAPVKMGSKGSFPPGAFIAASQHLGVNNQTDVFLVDNDGQLNVFWVRGAGNWSAPVKMGPKDIAVPGAPVAVSQQFGANDRTDVFLVDKTGTLYLFWVDGTGLWNGPKQLGPAGVAPSASASSQGAFVAASEQFGAPNQTDVFILNETGTNGPGWPTQFWVGGSGPWGGPVALVTEA